MTLTLLLKIVVITQNRLCFCISCRIFFLNAAANVIGILLEIALNLYNAYCRMHILNIIHEHNSSFLFLSLLQLLHYCFVNSIAIVFHVLGQTCEQVLNHFAGIMNKCAILSSFSVSSWVIFQNVTEVLCICWVCNFTEFTY